MDNVTILHCADLHLDSPLRGLEAGLDAPAARIRNATREALDNLVTLALDIPVKLVLIAGDLYDGDWRDWRTGLFLIRAIERLTRAGIRVAAISGNHDAENVITRRLRWPDGAKLFRADRPETMRLEDLGVAIHGRSFPARSVTDNFVSGYPEPVPGMLNIGLLHTALSGRPGHHSYAPCTIEQLAAKGYAYWALGHVHAREVVCRDPWIVFPGNIQGRHVRETGPKGATLITVREEKIASIEHRMLDTVRWAHIEVDLTGAVEEEEVLDRARAAFARAAQQADGRLLAARVRLTGACGAHAVLMRNIGDTREKLRGEATACAGDAMWIEQIELATAPVLDTDALRTRTDMVGLLARTLELAQPDRDEFLVGWAARMLDKGALRRDLGDDHPILLAEAGMLSPELVAGARNLLISRLVEE